MSKDFFTKNELIHHNNIMAVYSPHPIMECNHISFLSAPMVLRQRIDYLVSRILENHEWMMNRATIPTNISALADQAVQDLHSFEEQNGLDQP